MNPPVFFCLSKRLKKVNAHAGGYCSRHLPKASPTRILSPHLMENLNSDEESPIFTGAWKTITTVDPMLKMPI